MRIFSSRANKVITARLISHGPLRQHVRGKGVEEFLQIEITGNKVAMALGSLPTAAPLFVVVISEAV